MTTSVTAKPRHESTAGTANSRNGEIVSIDRPYPLSLIPSSVLGMILPPYAARVAAGAAVYAFEETAKLPSRLIALPMSVVSQLIQTGVQVQHFVHGLAMKGDELFVTLGLDAAEEAPEWARFDEDEITLDPVDTASAPAPGRFALYSTPVEPTAAKETVVTPILEPAPIEVPAIADEIDYSALTLAQLRARLKGLTLDDVTALLAYETATRGRAGFSAMLSERITALGSK
jgi:hypothetical protein